ncbi:hypothetical protein OBBRIDRAFT_594162 [Obba rivulosa]|uniref:Uncharacterized protein n=1 Tax=Obba rivulosa TaxID=1052685 RepID=A0A8E2DJM0_9APHY|nr:hypothetical protein OBBRIDRAFT_594162 [Obba rivulosa]
MRYFTTCTGPILDIFAPYRELEEATSETEIGLILSRVLTEWYVSGASLLTLSGIWVAIFGFVPASLFPFSQYFLAFGSTTAGFGIALNAIFLMLYGGASTARFQILARDRTGSYFIFRSLCRAPTFFTFLSSLTSFLFLLGLAWMVWPSMVLFCIFALAGVAATLYFLVYGFAAPWHSIRLLLGVIYGDLDAQESMAPDTELGMESGAANSGNVAMASVVEHTQP